MIDNLLYTIPKENHTKDQIIEILSNHPEIKFVSFVGIDLSGNDTDEKIPVNLFLEILTLSFMELQFKQMDHQLYFLELQH